MKTQAWRFMSEEKQQKCEMVCGGWWVMESPSSCSKSSRAGGRAGPRARSAGSCLAASLGGAHPETPQHLQRVKKNERKKKIYKGKPATIIFELSTRCCTLQSIVSCLTLSRGWKDKLHKFFLPSCDFLVGSKWCTKVSERIWLCHTWEQ